MCACVQVCAHAVSHLCVYVSSWRSVSDISVTPHLSSLDRFSVNLQPAFWPGPGILLPLCPQGTRPHRAIVWVKSGPCAWVESISSMEPPPAHLCPFRGAKTKLDLFFKFNRQPDKLVVVWTRRSRRKSSKVSPLWTVATCKSVPGLVC